MVRQGSPFWACRRRGAVRQAHSHELVEWSGGIFRTICRLCYGLLSKSQRAAWPSTQSGLGLPPRLGAKKVFPIQSQHFMFPKVSSWNNWSFILFHSTRFQTQIANLCLSLYQYLSLNQLKRWFSQSCLIHFIVEFFIQFFKSGKEPKMLITTSLELEAIYYLTM